MSFVVKNKCLYCWGGGTKSADMTFLKVIVKLNTNFLKEDKLKKTTFTLVILAVFVMLFSLSDDSANAQPPCRAMAYCWVTNDLGLNPLCSDGPYNPCWDYIRWTLEFDRTARTEDNTVLRIWIQGDNGWTGEYAQSIHYGPNQYHVLTGDDFVGKSSGHKLRVDRVSGPGGHFEDIEAEVNYLAEQPTEE